MNDLDECVASTRMKNAGLSSLRRFNVRFES